MQTSDSSPQVLSQPRFEAQDGELDPNADPRFGDIFDWVGRHAGISPGSLWLDIGCGHGQNAMRLRWRGYQVVAADISPERVRACAENIRRHGLGEQIKVCREDLVAGLSFPSGQFDVVLCWGVLMHIPHVEAAMLELVRVTRPGGRLLITEVNMNGLEATLTRLTSTAKRVLGRPSHSEIIMGAYGREYWTREEVAYPFIRHARIPSLISFFEAHGCRLVKRIGVEFTERASMHGLARKVARQWNRTWFLLTRNPLLVHTNLLIFERSA